MARPMEAVATDAVLIVELIGERIHISMLGHGLVEGRIKDPYLRDLRQDLRDSLDTEDVRRIVQRS